MKPISRINQSDNMPPMAEAIGRETNSGGHIVYLDKWLTRTAKPLKLRAVMQALGFATAKRDAVIVGFVAWKADGKAKGVTATVGAVVVAGVAAATIGLAVGHAHGHARPLGRPALSSSPTPSRSATRAPRAVRTPAHFASPAPTRAAPKATSSAPSSVMSYSYAPAEPVAKTVQPNPTPNAPSVPAPAVPSTRPANPSGATPRAAKSGICVSLRPVVKICLS